VRIKDIPKAFYVYRKTGNQTTSTLTWMKSVINGFRFFFCYEPLTIGLTCTKKGNGGDDDQHTSNPSANSPAADEIQVKKKKYDAHQTHVFLLLWKTKWPWVEYNTSKDVMFCQTCHKSAAHRFGAMHKVADKTDIKDWATVYKAQV